MKQGHVGAIHFQQEKQDKRDRDIFRGVALCADRALEFWFAAVAEADFFGTAQLYDAQG
jgi:hypothetical protein